MRYRLIKTQGVYEPPSHFWAADDEEAEYLAQREVSPGERVLLCRAPEDGIVREVCLIGTAPEVKKAKR